MTSPQADASDRHDEQDIALYANASTYDILHTPGTAEEVRDLEQVAARYARSRKRPLWLEPACGSGRYLRAAARRGTHSLGFDLDQGMVGYANQTFQRQALPARAVVADMTSFASSIGDAKPTFAFNTINTIRHLPDDASMLQHLEQTARVLCPKGVYLVGLSLARYGEEFPSEDLWSGVRGRCRVDQLVQFQPADPQERMERVYSVVTVTTPSSERHEPSHYALRSYSPAEWSALIEQSAMRIVESIDELGNPRDPEAPGYNLFVLQARSL